MNSFGNIFKISIFGSSHGESVAIRIDGCPKGLKLKPDDFSTDLERRKPGAKGTTKRIEEDLPNILTGVDNGKTNGKAIDIVFANRNVKSQDYEFDGFYRPGHADFTSHVKYKGENESQGGGKSSGRMTVAIVAAGVVAKKLIAPVKIESLVVEIGGSADFNKKLEETESISDSIGGVVECKAFNIPVGWGEPFFNSVESMISHAIFSIPGIKAIEFGEGIKGSRMFGSEFNDVFIDKFGTTATNNNGGINGGITNGNTLNYRVFARPSSSIGAAQKTFNFEREQQEIFKIKGRHDICFALRLPPVVEAVTAIVLADLKLVCQEEN